jgi:hypothetical protein
MESKKPRQADLQQAAAGAPAKRTYVTPRLLEYGSVAKLTAGGGTSSSDGGGMMQTNQQNNCL